MTETQTLPIPRAFTAQLVEQTLNDDKHADVSVFVTAVSVAGREQCKQCASTYSGRSPRPARPRAWWAAQGSHPTGCPFFGRIVLASSATLRHGRVAHFSRGNANRGDGSLAGRSFKSRCALSLFPPAIAGAPLAKSWNEDHVDHSPVPLTMDAKCEQEVNMYGWTP